MGFLVPFLVGGGARSQVTLFTYDLVLVCGTLYLARRRAWPALDLVSYVLTLVTLYGWATRDYDRREYWITELFLTRSWCCFCACGARTAGRGPDGLARVSAAGDLPGHLPHRFARDSAAASRRALRVSDRVQRRRHDCRWPPPPAVAAVAGLAGRRRAVPRHRVGPRRARLAAGRLDHDRRDLRRASHLADPGARR